MSTTSATDTLNSTVDNFSGGEPNRSDLVPAVVFLAALALSLPILAWRAISRKHRCWEMLNSALWFVTKTASLIMRAYMSRRRYGNRLLVAEIILTSISPLFLINSLIDLWQRHMETRPHDDASLHNSDKGQFQQEKTGKRKVTWVNIVAAILKVALLAAFAAAIAAGVLVGKDIATERQRRVISNLIKASYVMGLVISVISLLAKLIMHKTDGRSLKKQMLIYSYSIPLLVLSIYRVVEVFSGRSANANTLTAFYVALILFEVIAYGILLAVSIPKWFRAGRDHLVNHGDRRHRQSTTSDATAVA